MQTERTLEEEVAGDRGGVALGAVPSSLRLALPRDQEMGPTVPPAPNLAHGPSPLPAHVGSG